jgi:HEPN domain-containing protein
MESNKYKFSRTKNEVTEEATQLSDKLIKDLYSDYKQSKENPLSMQDAMDNVEDLAQITEILQRLISRRNTSYIKK